MVHSLLPDVERPDFDKSVRLDGHYYEVYEDNLCSAVLQFANHYKETLEAIQGKPLYVARESDLEIMKSDRPEAQELGRFLAAAFGVEMVTAMGFGTR